jgi:transglutaminase-like putative cysteine protease
MTGLRLPANPDTERLLWVGAIVCAASLPHLFSVPPWIPAFLFGAIALRVITALRGWRAPGRPLRLLLAFAAFCGVLARYRTINGIEAGSALLVVMMALKFLESRNHRDQLVLIMLSYFLMFASMLTERSPLTIVYGVILVWLTTVALLYLGRTGRAVDGRATARLALRLLLQSTPIMVVLFLLFPRLPGPLWAVQTETSGATTGLGEEMSPGDISDLKLSDAIAFRVQFDGRVPAERDLYWRGPVLSSFNGRTWRIAGGLRRVAPESTVDYAGEAIDYRVMLEPSSHGWAFGLDMPQAWSGPRHLRMNDDYQLGLSFAGPALTRYDYRATSYTRYFAREPLSDVQRRALTRLPPGSSPRTRELVAEWLASDPSPRQIVARAMDYLRSQPFYYTLTPRALRAEPVDEFLFDTREGFCEHYASAFAVMMRAAGLPARVVTGYQGGERNRLSDYYIVRQADAHAWTEVWLEDDGWVRVDPVTAVSPARVSQAAWRTSSFGERAQAGANVSVRIPWLSDARLLLDAGYFYWTSWVMGYGPEMQRALLDRFGLGKLPGNRASTLLLLVVAVTVAASTALSVYLAWLYRRKPGPDAAARQFAAFVRRLARLRVPPRGPSEGPRKYAARAQRSLPQAAADIDTIVNLYLRARYEPDASRAALAELRARVAAFAPPRVKPRPR